MFDKNYFILFFLLFHFSYELRNVGIMAEEEDKKQGNINVKPPAFSKISGFYENDFKLKLYSEDDCKIYYTLDSTDPRNSTTSKQYKDYIFIYDRSSEPNLYSAIGTNDSSPISIATSAKYNVPFYPVDKAMIVRAVTKNSEGVFSEVITKTFFITTEDLYKYKDQTVLSIVTNPENLFDPDFGIYVTGNMYQEAKKKAEEEGTDFGRGGGIGRAICNYRMRGKEWEREAFVTIIDKGEIHLQQKLGLRIKGAFTRNEPGKSFNLFAKQKYINSTI